MTQFKTFADLVFEDWGARRNQLPCPIDAKQAILNFDNGYGVSVLFGDCFYSNGIDTYELAVLRKGRLCYKTPVTDDVLGHITKEQVTEAMIQLQKLPK